MSELVKISIGSYTNKAGAVALVSGIILAGVGGYNGYASLLALGILLALSPPMIITRFAVGWFGNKKQSNATLSVSVCISLVTIILSVLIVQ